MHARQLTSKSMLLIAATLALAGCDRITGADQQKILDAESIGYACRVSQRTPEDCMKENESHSPTYVLRGWKAASVDIEDKIIDPSMGKNKPAHQVPQSAPAETPVEAKPATDKSPVAGKSAKGTTGKKTVP